MKNIIISGLVVILIGFGVWSLVSREDFDPDKISSGSNNATLSEIGENVAVVNGENITRAQFEELQSQIAVQQGTDVNSLDTETQIQLRAQVVDSLISQALLAQAVQESNVTISDAEVTAQIDLIKQRFEGDEGFQEALTAEGLSEEQLRSNISSEMSIQNYLEQQLNLSTVTVTEEEVASIYEEMSQGGEEAPTLEEVYDQVEGFVIQQRQQELVAEFISQLKADAQIEILI